MLLCDMSAYTQMWCVNLAFAYVLHAGSRIVLPHVQAGLGIPRHGHVSVELGSPMRVMLNLCCTCHADTYSACSQG
jgi:hypothetical protein